MVDLSRFEDFLLSSSIQYETNASLSRKTWIKTGGICKYWVIPSTLQQLETVCKYLYENNIEFDIVGQTSNIFFHESYSPGVVISTVHLNKYSFDESVITCDCGVSVVQLAKDCLAKGLAGFSGLTGLPGTVAASVYNNAGCFGCSISSLLLSVDCLLPDGTVKTFCKDELGYGHRTSVFKRKEIEGIILSIRLGVSKATDIEFEKNESEKAKKYRADNQERRFPNLGSVYSTLKLKKNVKNFVAVMASRALTMSNRSNYKKSFKKTILALYGFSDLANYISDKNINTFVWIDSGSEAKFDRYKEFMKRAYNGLRIEIEERK